MSAAATGVFLLSLSAVPIVYFCNHLIAAQSHLVVFLVGSSLLLLLLLASYFYFGLFHGIKNPYFYVFTIFSFTCVIDLVIGLELDGFIDNFISNYFKEGELYLATAHGAWISYWDGTGHYFLYLMMVAAITWNQDYRHACLYWLGSMINSMIILIVGALVGKFGNQAKAAIFLNVPYAIFPVIIAYNVLNQRPKREIKDISSHQCSIWKRPIDIFFILYLLALSVICVIRGLVALESPMGLPMAYLKNFEPYLADPLAFPKVQMLVYLFYWVPFYLGAIISLVTPGHEWIIDWSLIHAGVAAQAQVSHIGASFHYRTPYLLRVPEASGVFWIVNLSLLIVPHLLAWRCTTNPDFFVSFISKKTNGLIHNSTTKSKKKIK